MLPRGSGKSRGCVTNQAQDNDGNSTGKANPTPILDLRKYVVEFQDDNEDELMDNAIAQSMYSQCDYDSNQYLMIDYMVDFRHITTDLCYYEKNFVQNGGTYRDRSTSIWQMCCQWKDGATSQQKLADLKESNLIETVEYVIFQNLQGDPAFN